MKSKYDYNKEYAKKWNAENTKMLSVRLNKEDYEKVKKYCDENEVSVSQLIKTRLSDILDGSEN